MPERAPVQPGHDEPCLTSLVALVHVGVAECTWHGKGRVRKRSQHPVLARQPLQVDRIAAAFDDALFAVDKSDLRGHALRRIGQART